LFIIALNICFSCWLSPIISREVHLIEMVHLRVLENFLIEQLNYIQKANHLVNDLKKSKLHPYFWTFWCWINWICSKDDILSSLRIVVTYLCRTNYSLYVIISIYECFIWSEKNESDLDIVTWCIWAYI
jgi:hypothetical protein